VAWKHVTARSSSPASTWRSVHPLAAGTAWAACNGTVDLIECRAGRSADSSAASALLEECSAEWDRAWSAAWELAGHAALP